MLIVSTLFFLKRRVENDSFTPLNSYHNLLWMEGWFRRVFLDINYIYPDRRCVDSWRLLWRYVTIIVLIGDDYCGDRRRLLFKIYFSFHFWFVQKHSVSLPAEEKNANFRSNFHVLFSEFTRNHLAIQLLAFAKCGQVIVNCRIINFTVWWCSHLASVWISLLFINDVACPRCNFPRFISPDQNFPYHCCTIS